MLTPDEWLKVHGLPRFEAWRTPASREQWHRWLESALPPSLAARHRERRRQREYDERVTLHMMRTPDKPN